MPTLSRYFHRQMLFKNTEIKLNLLWRKGKKTWPSPAFPGKSSNVTNIGSLPVYSVCLITPYPLLHQSPVRVPSFGVHTSSVSCPTCRPCLSVSFWSPVGTCSQQCLKTGMRLWGGTKKKLQSMLRSPTFEAWRRYIAVSTRFSFRLGDLLVALPSSDSSHGYSAQPKMGGITFNFVLLHIMALIDVPQQEKNWWARQSLNIPFSHISIILFSCDLLTIS